MLLHSIEYENAWYKLLMDDLLYSIDKFSIHCVYEYDICISVPSTHGKVNALSQEMQTQKCIIIFLLLRTKKLEFHFLLNRLTYVV